jgi:hypothetical protein
MVFSIDLFCNFSIFFFSFPSRPILLQPQHGIIPMMLQALRNTTRVLEQNPSATNPYASRNSMDPLPSDPNVSIECEMSLGILKNMSTASENKQKMTEDQLGIVDELMDVVRLTSGKSKKIAYQVSVFLSKICICDSLTSNALLCSVPMPVVFFDFT